LKETDLKVKELFQIKPEACQPGLRVKGLINTDLEITLAKPDNPDFDFTSIHDVEWMRTFTCGHWNTCENEVVLDRQGNPVYVV